METCNPVSTPMTALACKEGVKGNACDSPGEIKAAPSTTVAPLAFPLGTQLPKPLCIMPSWGRRISPPDTGPPSSSIYRRAGPAHLRVRD
jgi:hypothetical protein